MIQKVIDYLTQNEVIFCLSAFAILVIAAFGYFFNFKRRFLRKIYLAIAFVMSLTISGLFILTNTDVEAIRMVFNFIDNIIPIRSFLYFLTTIFSFSGFFICALIGALLLILININFSFMTDKWRPQITFYDFSGASANLIEQMTLFLSVESHEIENNDKDTLVVMNC